MTLALTGGPTSQTVSVLLVIPSHVHVRQKMRAPISSCALPVLPSSLLASGTFAMFGVQALLGILASHRSLPPIDSPRWEAPAAAATWWE